MNKLIPCLLLACSLLSSPAAASQHFRNHHQHSNHGNKPEKAKGEGKRLRQGKQVKEHQERHSRFRLERSNDEDFHVKQTLETARHLQDDTEALVLDEALVNETDANSTLLVKKTPEPTAAPTPNPGELWALNYPNFANLTAQRQNQLQGMAMFYFATMGNIFWSNKTHWLNTQVSECLWYNQAEEDTCEGGMLVELELEDISARGTLPPQIGLLNTLEKLDLEDNDIGGSIPTQIAQLTVLEDLILEQNKLTGTLPSQIGAMKTLEELYLKENKITGTIPAQFGNLTLLEELDLSENELIGTIPQSFEQLVNMEYMYLDFQDYLNGTIPKKLFTLPRMVELNVEYNYLTGTIPDDIGILPGSLMEMLILQDNYFNGTLPATLGNLTNLHELALEDNYFTGTLPTELLKLTKLDTLKLDTNFLNGTVPVGYWSHPTLRKLELANNRFTGSLPTDIGMATDLEYLGLGKNQLNGTLPFFPGRHERNEDFRFGREQVYRNDPRRRWSHGQSGRAVSWWQQELDWNHSTLSGHASRLGILVCR